MAGSQVWPLTSLTISAPSFDGELSGGGVEGVYGDDGAGALFEDGFDDGEDAGLLLFGGEWGGVGAGGFAADVEDVGAFIEHREGLGEGSVGGVLRGSRSGRRRRRSRA